MHPFATPGATLAQAACPHREQCALRCCNRDCVQPSPEVLEAVARINARGNVAMRQVGGMWVCAGKGNEGPLSADPEEAYWSWFWRNLQRIA